MKSQTKFLTFLLLAFFQLISFTHTGQNKIIFSSKPFSKGGVEQTEFKANTPIYGRLVLDKPLKEFQINKAKTETPFTLHFNFLIKTDGVYSDFFKENGIIILTENDLLKKEIDFDIAPAKGTGTTTYFDDKEMYSGVTSGGLGDAPVEYKLVLDEMENANYPKVFKIDASGKFKVDFTGTTDETQLEWRNQCAEEHEAALKNEHKTNNATAEKKQEGIVGKNRIVFSTKHFSSNPPTQTTFKISDRIYAKMILEKPLKEFCSPKFYDLKEYYGITDKNVVRVMSFIVKYKNEDGDYLPLGPITVDMSLTKDNLESKEVLIDIIPSKEEATTVYSSGSEFFRALIDKEFVGKKYDLKFELTKQEMSGIANIDFDSKFSIDYTSSSDEEQDRLFEYGQKANEAAKENSFKASVKAGIQAVKAMPVPLCFSKAGNPGYKSPENSNAAIINLIKQKYDVTEVLKLTFDKADGVDDFRTLVDANTNVASCKMGNHVFYFAFKDKDGSYRFTGGTLRRDHVGFGKFGELYIQDYGPIQEGDAKYPLDVYRDYKGIHGVCIFDGTKLK
ncbi:MAG: hypothetical protein V4565_05995 [Bacteroidota bacterium]